MSKQNLLEKKSQIDHKFHNIYSGVAIMSKTKSFGDSSNMTNSVIASTEHVKSTAPMEVKSSKIPTPSLQSTQQLTTTTPVIEKIKIKGKLSPTQQDLIEGDDFNSALYLISQFLALIIIALVACWLIGYFGGFSIDNIINFHPLIMIFSMVYILANSLLFMNLFNSKSLQSIRLFLCVFIILIGLVGSIISIYWHSKKNLPHFQSIHSWLGTLTWIVMAIYYFFGYHVYFHIGYTNQQRLEMMFYFRMFGIYALIMNGTTCLIGLNQALLLKVLAINSEPSLLVSSEGNSTITEPNFDELQKEQVISLPNIVANIIGIFLVCYILSMIYMVAKMRYKPRTSLRRQQMERQLRETIKHAMSKLKHQSAFDNDKQNNRPSISTTTNNTTMSSRPQ